MLWFAQINLATYRAFADDKRRAAAGFTRIPERRLLGLAARGGAIGAMIAQRRLRHKTRKQPFASRLRRIAIIQALPLLAAAATLLIATPAAASFVCARPTHHDGDAIRCAGQGSEGKSMRLYGIDAPEMPGACRPGRSCTPGNPFAARNHLARLTRGRRVVCQQRDTDSYGRRVVECRADGINLSCAMIAARFAVRRYGRPDCRLPMRIGG